MVHAIAEEPTVIAVCASLVERLQQRADGRGVRVRFVGVSPSGEIAGEPPRQVDAVLRAARLQGPAFERLLARFQPRWIHAASAGVDGVLSPALVERGIVVTRTRGLHGTPVAEFAMALILQAAKELPALMEARVARRWNEVQPRLVQGATLTIVGYGEIGHALAARARAFGMRVVGVRRQPRPEDQADEVVGPDQLHPALAQADYVVLIAPATPDTRHLIGEAELAVFKPTAYLVNVGRGSLVDEPALDRALRAGTLAGALLDTFAQEPLPADHVFWQNPRVFITPHAAGLRIGSFDAARIDRYLDAVTVFIRGGTPPNAVDLHLGY